MKKHFLLLALLVLPGCVTTPETGSQAFIITSKEQEASLGEQAYREMLSKERLSSNARYAQILQRVGKRIAEAANQPDFQWEFRLIESRDKNAFCLPGGKVAFYTGIFPVAQNEAALAAIMGHEVAHAVARHGGQRMTLAFGTELAFESLNHIMGARQSQQKGLLLAAMGLGAQVGVALPFSRSHETEADEIGLLYMARAGYDPKEAPKFWARFGAETRGMPKFLSTHPPSSERQAALEAELPRAEREYARSEKLGTGETL